MNRKSIAAEDRNTKLSVSRHSNIRTDTILGDMMRDEDRFARRSVNVKSMLRGFSIGKGDFPGPKKTKKTTKKKKQNNDSTTTMRTLESSES